ncbi:hypothetical protein MCOR25_003918 [Pyricularia grisea]|nr:hypothetical protein MCOR25_003918 [Pyricularia grisea]
MKAIRSIAWRTSRPLQQQHPLAGPQRALLSRYFSTNPPSPEGNEGFAARLRGEMLARPPTWIEDILSPTRSKLLDLALADHLPAEAKPEAKRSLMPAGHHLVYFPPLLTESELLPDGTDPKHSPGPGFSRRLWAGGNLVFPPGLRPEDHASPPSSSNPAGQSKSVVLVKKTLAMLGKNKFCACRESIADVTVRGQPGREKVYVELSREYGNFSLEEMNLPIDERTFYLSISERRTLVFLRDEEVEVDVAKARDQTTASSSSSSSRTVRAPSPHKPDYSFELTPSRRLLFHFSALTHNAHLIHLDREYCRASEGHRDLLVHGPLSLVLMLKALQAAASPLSNIVSIRYRNLAPLYVGETMRVCVRRVPSADAAIPSTEAPPSNESWDIWIERPDGGMAVKASAVSNPKQLERKIDPLVGHDNVSPGHQEPV